jgi:hydrogenase maturation protease
MLSVIGCGNLNRSDDGVGVVVAKRLDERLRRHPVPGVRVFDCGTAGMEVMFAARGSEALLVLDACRTGAAPGTLYDVPGDVVARERQPSLSLHDFRWDDALAVGRKIFQADFPADVRVWLVEAETLALGLDLSPVVSQAADELYRRALAHIADYAARRHAAQPALEVSVKRGSVQLPRAVYERYFEGRDGVVLFDKDDALCLLPVEQVSGGVLVKLRNKEGDRTILATEFLRTKGWDDWGEYTCPARWDSELGALALQMPPRRP